MRKLEYEKDGRLYEVEVDNRTHGVVKLEDCPNGDFAFVYPTVFENDVYPIIYTVTITERC